MLQRLRTKLTYANVVSSVCMFVLLGGVAYAGAQLPAGGGHVATVAKKKKAKRGPRGPQGPAGVSGYVQATLANTISTGETKTTTPLCPSGKVPLGGGARVTGGADSAIESSSPTADGWATTVHQTGAGTSSIQAFAVCAAVTG